MLITALRAYAERDLAARLADQAFETRPVKYLITLDEAGRFLAPLQTTVGEEPLVLPTRRRTRPGPARDRGRAYRVPRIPLRTSDVKTGFLVDKREYVLGIGPPDQLVDPLDVRRQAAFRALIEAASEDTSDLALAAVAAFCASPAERRRVSDALDALAPAPGALLTFTVAPELTTPVFERPTAETWWTTHFDELLAKAEAASGRTGMCLACGQERPIERSHPIRIKGVPGTQGAGAALISANDEVFWSWGWEASHNSPVCSACARGYAEGLNALLADRRTALRLGRDADEVFVVWTDAGPSNVISLFEDPQPEAVRDLVRAPYVGRRPAAPLDERLHVLALGGNSGRIVVRAWMDIPLAAAHANLARWFDDLGLRLWRPVWGWRGDERALLGGSGEPAPPLRLRELAESLVSDPRSNPPPAWIATSLVRAALFGERLPHGLLSLGLRRFAIAQGSDRDPGGLRSLAAAALLRLYLVRADRARGIAEEKLMPAELDPDRLDTAYRCGRALATLRAIQRRANPRVNATIVDRYYQRASKAPASVFPLLLALGQNHLSSIRRAGAGGLAKVLEDQLGEVLERIERFPRTLDLEGQGRFALGFAHQQAADARLMRERIAAKLARGETSDAESTLLAAADAAESTPGAGDEEDSEI